MGKIRKETKEGMSNGDRYLPKKQLMLHFLDPVPQGRRRSLVRPLCRLKGLARAVVCFASIRESNFFPDKTALENCVAKQNGGRFIGV